MGHFTISQDRLFYTLPLPVNEQKKLDAFLLLLEKSCTWKYLGALERENALGRPKINECRLFAAVLYCFVLGKDSLREIETACVTDLRIIYLIGGDTASFSSISRFITSLIPNMPLIFSTLIESMFKDFGVDLNTVFLDGSKFEANANKYKFVWKPTTMHIRLSEKTLHLLKLMHLDSGMPDYQIIPSKIILQKITEAKKLNPQDIEGGEKALKAMRDQLSQYLMKSIEYEEKEKICGENRNSYFKTDHDATAMCLKRDHYSGLGSNMHAAYNVQILVSRGFIVLYYLSQDRSDAKTLEPTIEKYYEWYGRYPQKLCADAGYGNFYNYEYCARKGIEAFVKYSSWNVERTGRNPATYEYINEEVIVCLGQKIGTRVSIPDKNHNQPNSHFYRVTGCNDCAFESYCKRQLINKTGNDRIFDIQPQAALLKQQARERLKSPEGIELRVNRSCQVEGAFGVIKQNMDYDRFRRRTKERVTVEFALTCLGMNIRKYLRFIGSGKLPFYWKAPDDLTAETFRKPSAKRIAKRMARRMEKAKKS